MIHKDAERFKLGVTSSIVAAIVLVVFLIFISVYSFQTEQDKREQQEYSQQIDMSLEHTIKHFMKDYVYRTRRIVETTDIASMIESGDREAAYRLLEPKFRLMREESEHFKIMHLHLSDGSSFLRVHKREKYGDRISEHREMLRYIHKHHKLITGYETGKYATVYRVITPIFNKKGVYIGAFEVGINPNFILNAVNEINGFEGMVFIKKNELQLYSQPNSVEIGEYRLQSDITPELKRICEISERSRELKSGIEIDLGDVKYITHLVTLKNFSGEESVKIIFFQRFLKKSLLLNMTQYYIYITVLFILVAMALYVYRRIGRYQKDVSSLYLQQIEMINKSEKELAFNKKYLESIFDVTPSVMIITNGEEIDRANPAMLEFFGYESLEAFKAEHQCICEYFTAEKNCLNRVVDGISWLEYILSRPDEIHYACMYKNDQRFHFIVGANRIRIDDKNRSVVIFNDITESEYIKERLEIAVNGTNDGLWDWNLQTGELYFSPQWKKQVGYEDNELENSIETWASLVHPDDKENAERDYTENMEGKTDFYENIHRLRHKDGSWVWILDRGQTKFDEDGQAVRMVGFHTDITAQKNLEDELRASQELFAQFMGYIPANIYIAEDNKAIYANANANRFFGRESIVGMKPEEILLPEEAKMINRGYELALEKGIFEGVMELTNSLGEKEIHRELAFKIQTEKGSKVGLVSIDITKEFLLAKELKKEGKRSKELGNVLENSINEIYIFAQSDFKFLYLNQGAKANIGYSLEEMLEMTPLDIKPEMSLEKFNEIVKAIKENIVESVHTSTVHQRKNGTTYPVDIYLQSINYEDVDAYIAIIIDITERIKIEDELHSQEDLMIAQSRHAAMGEMISMIAHQWRQPISVISMDANNILADIELEMLEESSLKTTSEDIIKQTQELSQTIDDFRNFFQPEKEAQEVLVKELFDNALAVIGKSLDNNQVTYTLEMEEDIKVTTYTRELMQVFINIIKNAKEVLVENKVKDKKVFVRVKEDKEELILKICDNAGGIKKENMKKIFNPYFTTKGEKNGTGLGLYMSKTIIEKHLNGIITAYNLDTGACFEIRLPMNRVDGERNG